ncbi:hypothetical protein HanHA300_Chr12g0451771 [Helianthus annuus]|nr:hypothetical protein HanHA300_Chr12g0451771 [Helianthus annuus]
MSVLVGSGKVPSDLLEPRKTNRSGPTWSDLRSKPHQNIITIFTTSSLSSPENNVTGGVAGEWTSVLLAVVLSYDSWPAIKHRATREGGVRVLPRASGVLSEGCGCERVWPRNKRRPE